MLQPLLKKKSCVLSSDFLIRCFFGGTLEAHCLLDFSSRRAPWDKSLGYTGWKIRLLPPHHFLKLQCHIRVHLLNNKVDDPRRCCYARIETLIHEMVHAFFTVYYVPNGRPGWQQLTGWTSHGHAWQSAAMAVELALRDPDFVNLPLTLERHYHWIMDYNVSGGELVRPEVAVERKWGFDINLIEESFRVRKESREKAVTFREIVSQIFKQVRVHDSGFLP